MGRGAGQPTREIRLSLQSKKGDGQSLQGPASTLPAEQPQWSVGFERVIRAVTLIVVFSVVGLGAVGTLGVSTTTVGNSDNGYRIDVTYADVTRGGLATPFSITASSDDDAPLPPNVTIRLTSHYLALFDQNGIEPTPRASFNTSGTTWWEFEIPEGQTMLAVDLDARLEPAVQSGQSATVELWVDDERMVSTGITTRVMP